MGIRTNGYLHNNEVRISLIYQIKIIVNMRMGERKKTFCIMCSKMIDKLA
jgi:hypothetical protein